MSALTLMSVIAPSVPSAPQGSSGEAASGFQDLLAAMSGEDAAVPAAKTGEGETGTPHDTKATGAADAGFLAAPIQPPVPLVLPAAPDVPANSDVKALADEGSEDRPVVMPPAPAVVSGPSDDPPVMPLQPTDKNPGPKTNDPQTPPVVTEFRPYRDEVRGPLIATVAQTAAALEAINAEARASATASTAPSTPPPVAPAPAPLRALAERTSRPVEPSVGKTGEEPRAAAASAAAPAAATAAPAVAAAPAPGAADLLAAAAREAAADTVGTEEPTPDLPPPGEGATAQTQASAATRETGVSQLSRATIEATAQIAAQILRRLEGRSTRFEMALTPDELGRVDVKLDIDAEGRLNARLAFDNPAAATDLRGRADELRRQLEDAGFHLAADAFEFAERDSGSSAFDRGQDARNGSSRAFAAASRLNAEIDVAQPPRWLALSLSPSGVDMKV
jgi:flagellar hook-length control protein FliK